MMTATRCAGPTRSCARPGLVHVDAPQEITEALFRLALRGVAGDELVEHVDDRRLVDVVAMDDVEPRADGVTTEAQCVAARRTADQRDFGEIGARATVRASGDTHGQRGV